MFPQLFDFGEVTLWGRSFHPILHTYGFLLAVGFLIALKLAASRAQSIGVETRMTMDLGLYILISGLIGARLLLVIVNWEHMQHDPWSLLRSGGVFYGGLLAATITALWYFWKHRLPAWKMADILAPSVALGHGIGRLFWASRSGRTTRIKSSASPWGSLFIRRSSTRRAPSS
jgi:phosphatidylglycerol:prolipoprotein diacylglycerol transferase